MSASLAQSFVFGYHVVGSTAGPKVPHLVSRQPSRDQALLGYPGT
jgi:hypothetical protein